MMMKMGANPSTFVDTNILLRYLINDFQEHPLIKKEVDDLIYQGHYLWISRQIIREFATICTRPQAFMQTLSATQTIAYIVNFTKIFRIADEDSRVTQALIQLMQVIPIGGKQIHDANIVATMQVYQIQNLVTLNLSDFVRFQSHIHLIKII